METKMLNVDKKVFLGMLSVILVITVILPLVFAYKPYTVGIQVKNPSGKPVVGALVTISGSTYTTENGGWLKLEGFTENTYYTGKATRSDGTDETDFSFTTDEKASAMVKITLEDIPEVVSVTVVDKALGNPVEGATVYIWDMEDHLLGFWETDESGIAIIGLLDPYTDYFAEAEKDSLYDSSLFTTNEFGGANILLELEQQPK